MASGGLWSALPVFRNLVARQNPTQRVALAGIAVIHSPGRVPSWRGTRSSPPSSSPSHPDQLRYKRPASSDTEASIAHLFDRSLTLPFIDHLPRKGSLAEFSITQIRCDRFLPSSAAKYTYHLPLR